jgi:hypothetical protein
MRHDELIQRLIEPLEGAAFVVGAYVGGSQATADHDQLADIDLGVATRDTEDALEATYALGDGMLRGIGAPLEIVRRGWAHCRMIAALCGADRYPPCGLSTWCSVNCATSVSRCRALLSASCTIHQAV